ncbi:signal recognition particle-docking protein FtsY [Isachenkonia alkalipeptolytica]|uniref:Signal recognition particle receptor FtsY n=1 Tax=Isachenkonia alkalipeptolytica TaxID=2565777 RepID=A0AA43XME0_9CLOT|nr:signal recognition particle-docking protein FtsY [Isachenkonia alkalipeptolytica]NBG89101.1 signal recognition particle-docking protein FtsY [Isachenkonia alkalipeptolytica]
MLKNLFKKSEEQTREEESKEEQESTPEEGQSPASSQEEETPGEGVTLGGLFGRLKEGLTKTKKGITDRVDDMVKSYTKIDEDLFEELEEILITADLGVNTTMEIIDQLRDRVRENKTTDPMEVKGLLKELLTEALEEVADPNLNLETTPSVIMVVGVNGVGKTTSIGKIAHKLKGEGKKVLLAAGDTFRAGAIDQLKIWGERSGIDVISHQEGSDPAAVVYDAIQAAKSRKVDVLICDTAGRLHNKKNLMNELGKVFKIVNRECDGLSRESLLVLDATTGQNAIQQAKIFKEVTNISGLVLTKLDGTAKGGIVISVSKELKVPVKLIGVGEKLEDLQSFEPKTFVEALFD